MTFWSFKNKETFRTRIPGVREQQFPEMPQISGAWRHSFILPSISLAVATMTPKCAVWAITVLIVQLPLIPWRGKFSYVWATWDNYYYSFILTLSKNHWVSIFYSHVSKSVDTTGSHYSTEGHLIGNHSSHDYQVLSKQRAFRSSGKIAHHWWGS